MLSDRVDSYNFLQAQLSQLPSADDDAQQQASFKEELEYLSQRWTSVNTTSVTHQAELGVLLATSGEYSAQLETFTAWLNGVERRLGESKAEATQMDQLSHLLQQLIVCVLLIHIYIYLIQTFFKNPTTSCNFVQRKNRLITKKEYCNWLGKSENRFSKTGSVNQFIKYAFFLNKKNMYKI